MESRLGLIDGQQIVVDDRALGGMRPLQRHRSTGGARVSSCVPNSAAPSQQQFAQAVATPLQIFTRIIPRPGQVAHGLVLEGRRLHRCQQPRTPQLCQLPCIAAIRLHPLTWLPRHQRRRDHVAAHPRRRHLSLQRVPTRPGLVEDAAPSPVPRARASAPVDAPPSARSPVAKSPAFSRCPSASRRTDPSCVHRCPRT